MCSTRERERHKSVGTCDLFFCPIKSNQKSGCQKKCLPPKNLSPDQGDARSIKALLQTDRETDRRKNTSRRSDTTL